MSTKSTSTEYKVQHSYHQFLLDVAAYFGQQRTKDLLAHLLREMLAGHIEGHQAYIASDSCGCIIAHIADQDGVSYGSFLNYQLGDYTDMPPWEQHLVRWVHANDTPQSNPELARFYAWTAEFLATLA